MENVIELAIKIVTGETKLVKVSPGDTIRKLKEIIAPRFESRASCLKLYTSDHQILDNDQKTVSDYCLSSGSTVVLLILVNPVPFQVFVKNEKGQTKTYDINDDETVKQLMTKVCQNEGIPVDQQRLIYNGKQLEPGKKLQDYNIQSGGTIYMTLRLRGG